MDCTLCFCSHTNRLLGRGRQGLEDQVTGSTLVIESLAPLVHFVSGKLQALFAISRVDIKSTLVSRVVHEGYFRRACVFLHFRTKWH